jgi:hypothetical protein
MLGIINLKNYDLVITTSFEFNFGVCGHLFEMIDYYHAVKTYTNLKPCILLSDGTTRQQLLQAVDQKYFDLTIDDIVEQDSPKVIIAKNLLVVDGSPRLKNADLLVDRIFLFRCSESDFSYYASTRAKVLLMQDFDVYGDQTELVPVLNYKKKILFSKYKPLSGAVDTAAMFYLTDLCRALSQIELESLIKKHGFEKNIILTNNRDIYSLEHVYQVPVENIWNKFSTYIYTKVPRQIDCSSRFILECAFYDKQVIYDIDYYDKALEVRKADGLKVTQLTATDEFLKLLNE